jgi:hypothetical protein
MCTACAKARGQRRHHHDAARRGLSAQAPAARR